MSHGLNAGSPRARERVEYNPPDVTRDLGGCVGTTRGILAHTRQNQPVNRSRSGGRTHPGVLAKPGTFAPGRFEPAMGCGVVADREGRRARRPSRSSRPGRRRWAGTGTRHLWHKPAHSAQCATDRGRDGWPSGNQAHLARGMAPASARLITSHRCSKAVAGFAPGRVPRRRGGSQHGSGGRTHVVPRRSANLNRKRAVHCPDLDWRDAIREVSVCNASDRLESLANRLAPDV